MLMILIALVAGMVLCWVLFRYADNECSPLVGFLAITLATSMAFVSCLYAFNGWNWIASGHKAKIINREYGTNYTQEEVFWASDVIETVRELERKRIEVNGDLITGKDDGGK